MASFKYYTLMTKSEDESFDCFHPPGAITPAAGIYRCVVCKLELMLPGSSPLPPHDHHQHLATQDAIRWRLLVALDERAAVG
jgi:hypothetical protein